MSDDKKVSECLKELPKYEPPKLNTEGNYSNIFFGIRGGGGCASCCSRHMPEM